MKAKELAKWFMNSNSALCNGYNDGNTKLNKLLFYSNLMYYCINDSKLIDEPFEKWDKGPVIRSLYADYKYNELYNIELSDVKIEDDIALKILNIINLVYGDMSAKDLSEKSHESPIWQTAQRNEVLDFSNVSEDEKRLMNNLYMLYKNFDFENCGIEKVNGNKYYFDKRCVEANDELIKYLETIPYGSDPKFIELIDGEYVLS